MNLDPLDKLIEKWEKSQESWRGVNDRIAQYCGIFVKDLKQLKKTLKKVQPKKQESLF